MSEKITQSAEVKPEIKVIAEQITEKREMLRKLQLDTRFDAAAKDALARKLNAEISELLDKGLSLMDEPKDSVAEQGKEIREGMSDDEAADILEQAHHRGL